MLGWRLRTQGLIMQFSPQGTNIQQSPGITTEKMDHKTIGRRKSELEVMTVMFLNDLDLFAF